jgi:plastocyanin
MPKLNCRQLSRKAFSFFLLLSLLAVLTFASVPVHAATVTITFTANPSVGGFAGVIIDYTTGTAASNPATLTVSTGDQIELDANVIAGHNFLYFEVGGNNVGQGTFYNSIQAYAYVYSASSTESVYAVYGAVSSVILTFTTTTYISGFAGVIIDYTTGAAASNPATLPVSQGDQIECDANMISGYDFGYFLIGGVNEGQGLFYSSINAYTYVFYATTNETVYAYYTVATGTPTPTPSGSATPTPSPLSFNLASFRDDLTSILLLVIGALLTFGGVLIFTKASSAWLIGTILILAGFFTLIVGEPNLYGLVAWALSIVIFGVFCYSGVQKPK